MIELPKQIKHGQWTLTQLIRDGARAIYRQTKTGSDREWFEVILIREEQERELFGTTRLAQESYPGNSDWGKFGWTFQTRADANRKFDQLPAVLDRPKSVARTH